MLSSLAAVITLLLVWMLGLRLRSTLWMLILAIMAASINFTYQSVTILEWSLVILFASSFCLIYFFSFDRRGIIYPVLLFLLGLVGSLSRSDFGLLPLSIFVSSLLIRKKGVVVKGLAGLLGATTGVILIFVQNYIYSGQIIQASALMKAHWGSYLQGTLFDPLYLALLTIGISDKIHSIA